jgi:putative transposase
VLHLASVLDLFSRRIVGWAMSPIADAELVASALQMGIDRRRPGDGLIHHSDRGTQYTALAFTQRCADAAVIQSNSRPGTPHDNAVKESFFATLQKEKLNATPFATHEQARSAIFVYIECFYNRDRLHSTLAYRTPAEAENDHYQQAACAS